MDLGITYNAADLPEQKSFKTIPAGWYQAVIDSSEVKVKEEGRKKGMSSKYKILGPSNANRSLYDYINLKNPSEECEAIGRQDLGSLIRAVGIPSLQNTDQLIGKTLEIMVSREMAKSDYDRENEDEDGYVNRIKKYRSISGPASGPIGGPAQAPPVQGGGATAPWNK